MYIVSTDFHELLEHRLTKWLMKQNKLILNTQPGTSDDVITVNPKDGIVYDLKYFSEGYINKYYNKDKFAENSEKLAKALSKIVKETALELRKYDITISTYGK
jgi:hypothetical protein